MASGKGKVSKNSKKGSKSNFEYVKKVRPRKETILVEITKEILSQNPNIETLTEFNEKPVIKITEKFGKKYLLLKNI